MADKPEFEELEKDKDQEGETETRMVQSMGRIDVPDEFWDHLDIEEGDKVFVVCKEDSVEIVEASASRLI